MKALFPSPRKYFPKQKPLAALAAGGLILLSLAVRTAAAKAAPLPDVTVQSNQTTEDFPNTITFQLEVHSSTPVQQIVLEYGANQTTCGDVIGKAYPDFQPGADVTADWTWDMRQSGSEPPGATIWWQWHVIDSNGQDTVVDKKQTLWLDAQHAWRSLSGGGVTLHWYRTDAGFGKQMHDTAVHALEQIHTLIDLQPQGSIDIYLYSTYQDLWDSVLYEPGWTGGLSFSGYNIIILGIPSGEETWGMGAIAHELMHTVVDDSTFSCLVEIPTWLNEGLAVVSQGGPGAQELVHLQNAIKQNTIVPLHSLGGNFPEDADQAQLAYDESYSVVNYLLQTEGAAQMRSLLDSLSGGTTIDDALNAVYGFTVDGLDAAWRKSVGAQPLPASQLEPTATPTFVPTFEPLSVNPAATLASSPTAGGPNSTAAPKSTPTPTSGVPTPTPTSGVPTPTPSSGIVASGSTGTVLVLCVWMLCLALVLAVGATMIILVSRRRR